MLISRKTSVRTMQSRHDPIQNKQNEETVYLYGEIGGWWGIDAEEFVQNFSKINADVIHLRINSEGGDVFAARSMKTAIIQNKAKVIAHIDGIAASAASFMAMGADEIEIVDGGFFMIHNAISLIDILGFYNLAGLEQISADLAKEKELHAQINDSIANDYMKRTGNTKEQIQDWMNQEKWFSASAAVENKFADRVYDGEPVGASYDLSHFSNTPEAITLRNQQSYKRTIERALRDAGCSKSQAKAILKGGYAGDLRDAESDNIKPPEPTLRDAIETKEEKRKDRVADLLIRAEIAAPSLNL